jgi:hypothetical protein
MHDFGTLVWVIIVIIGVISTMTRGARRTARQPAHPFTPASYAPATPAPQPASQAAPDLRAELAGLLGGAVTQQPRPAPVRKTVVPAAAPVAAGDMGPETLAVFEAHPSARHRRRIFANRNTIKGGIIAAQVFGPPLALGGARDRLF